MPADLSASVSCFILLCFCSWRRESTGRLLTWPSGSRACCDRRSGSNICSPSWSDTRWWHLCRNWCRHAAAPTPADLWDLVFVRWPAGLNWNAAQESCSGFPGRALEASLSCCVVWMWLRSSQRSKERVTKAVSPSSSLQLSLLHLHLRSRKTLAEGRGCDRWG